MVWYETILMWFGTYTLIGLFFTACFLAKSIKKHFKNKSISEEEFDSVTSAAFICTFLWIVMIPFTIIYDIREKRLNKFEVKVLNMKEKQLDLVEFLTEINVFTDEKSNKLFCSIVDETNKKITEKRKKFWV